KHRFLIGAWFAEGSGMPHACGRAMARRFEIGLFFVLGISRSFAESSTSVTNVYDATHAPAHAPVSDGSYQFQYDANGNTKAILTTSNSAVQTFSYNAQNKVSTFKDQYGSVVSSYKYDANGNRVVKISGSKTEKLFGAVEIINGSRKKFYFASN